MGLPGDLHRYLDAFKHRGERPAEILHAVWRDEVEDYIDTVLCPELEEKLPLVTAGTIDPMHTHNAVAALAVLVSEEHDAALNAIARLGEAAGEESRAVLLQVEYRVAAFRSGQGYDWPVVEDITDWRLRYPKQGRINLSINPAAKIDDVLRQVREILERRQEEHYTCQMAEEAENGTSPVQTAELHDLLTIRRGGVGGRLEYYFDCLRCYDYSRRHPDCILEEVCRQSWWPTTREKIRQNVLALKKKAEKIIDRALSGGAVWRI